jgi:sugar transferase (PEP-CTERM/EpsH1 system associated)
MHVVDTLGSGGLQNGLVNVIHGLDAGQFEHVVCAVRGLGANANRLPDGVPVRCLSREGATSSFQVSSMIRAIREIKPDIVHSRNWGAVEAVIAGRWVRSCAVVHSEHGLDSNTPDREPWRRRCFRRLAFELADRVFAVSAQLRDVHSRRTGFPASKITVIHNGVDHRRFFPDATVRVRVRKELGLSGDEFCIGCVGSLFPVKDHMTLLRAVGEMAKDCDNWRLLIVGEGPERPKLEALVNGHPEWRRRVSLLGSSNRVAELLQAMDAYVLPSVMEGISNSLLEAMATGVAVVVTSTGGNTEVVTDGHSGLLFAVGDVTGLAERLRALRAHGDLRVQLGGQAVRRVREQFSLDSMVRNYERLYEGLGPAAIAPVRATAGA